MALGPNRPSIHWVPWFVSGEKRMKPDADHSHRTGVEVKNEWSYTFDPHVCFHGVGWDEFTFAPLVIWNDIRGNSFSWKWERLLKIRK